MDVIGLKCRYLGDSGGLRGRGLIIVGVLRGPRACPEAVIVITDAEELLDWPVQADELVRVRIAGTKETSDVRAVDLDVFRHLGPPRTLKLDVQIEEANARALMFAARSMRRPLDAVLNDAVAAHVRALGVGRTTSTALVGLPTAN